MGYLSHGLCENYKHISLKVFLTTIWSQGRSRAGDSDTFQLLPLGGEMPSVFFRSRFPTFHFHFRGFENECSEGFETFDNEIEISRKLFKIEPDMWNDMIKFGIENNLLGQEEVKLLQLIPFGKVPSARQQERIVKILEKLEDEGMETPW